MTNITDELTCGVDGHDSDCLCDVKITEPTPIRYGFADCWKHADIVQRATGYEDGEGGAQLADFLEALARGFDATQRMRGEGDVDTSTEGLSTVREALSQFLQSDPEASIVDAPEAIGESWPRIAAAVTNGKASILHTWHPDGWGMLEAALRDTPTRTANTIAQKFELTEKAVTNLMHLYGIEPPAAVRKERTAAMRELIDTHPNATVRELYEMITALGWDIHIANVRRFRDRHLAKAG